MKRKEFIRFGTTAVASTIITQHLVGCETSNLRHCDEVLVVVKLQGGMDGYHLLAPVKNDIFASQRPSLHQEINNSGIIWKGDWAFHPKFKILNEMYQKGWLKIIPNIGFNDYKRLSHFKAMDYWETGSVVNDDRIYQSGWLGRLVDNKTIFVRGNESPVLIMDRSETRFHKGDISEGLTYTPFTPTGNFHSIIDEWLNENSHLMNTDLYKKVENQQKVSEGLKNIKPISVSQKNIKGKLDQVAECIEQEQPFAVYGLTQKGYDTHHKQSIRLEPLAMHLFEGLNTFATRLSNKGLWNRVKVLVYTEFSRTIAENRNLGTDHGTANHAYVLGGNLERYWDELDSSFNTIKLAGRDYVKHNTDFREVYKKIIPNQA